VKGINMRDILIVDDQSYMEQLLSIELADNNYTVIGAEDIEKARVYLDNFKLDLVILDLYINGFYGWDLLEEIKQKHHDLPVLIVTAYDNLMNDHRTIQADAYLVKNFENIALISEKVNALLS
jgi:two-component system, OmpR family, response regulator